MQNATSHRDPWTEKLVGESPFSWYVNFTFFIALDQIISAIGERNTK